MSQVRPKHHAYCTFFQAVVTNEWMQTI